MPLQLSKWGWLVLKPSAASGEKLLDHYIEHFSSSYWGNLVTQARISALPIAVAVLVINSRNANYLCYLPFVIHGLSSDVQLWFDFNLDLVRASFAIGTEFLTVRNCLDLSAGSCLLVSSYLKHQILFGFRLFLLLTLMIGFCSFGSLLWKGLDASTTGFLSSLVVASWIKG